jgi:predicted DNA-binding transcriptional regulator YafY
MTSEVNRGKSASRPLRMLALMMSGEILDANSAAKRFGVQRAMARRDLIELAKHISAIEQNRSGRLHTFRFRVQVQAAHGTAHAPTKLHDAIAAALGASFSRVFHGTRYQTDLEKLRKGVVANLARRRDEFEHANRKFFALMGREEVLEEQSERLDEVVQAVLTQRTVEMHYSDFKGQAKQLRVNPYSLVIYDSHLYVVGSDVTEGLAKPVHPFRFARIRKLNVTKQHFEYPAPTEYDPKVIFRESIGVWLSDPGPCKIRVRMTEYWANYAQHHRWHDSQRVAKNPDGSFELTLHVRPCPELEQWVLRFGENVEVLEPVELRKTIGKRLRSASRLYSRRAGPRPQKSSA